MGALTIIGCLMIIAGLVFALKKVAGDRAGGSALKGISVQGPAWLLLVAMGGGLVVVDKWFDAESAKKDVPTEVTAPPTYTLQDDHEELPFPFDFGDDEYLDGLWTDCSRGIWKQCDELYFDSPTGSEYEWYGATCGWIIPDPTEFCSPSNN